MNIKALSLVLISGLCSTAQAAGLLNNEGLAFNAINHLVISDNVAPAVPSPGDTFVLNGFGTVGSQFPFELSYSYSIAGQFISFSDNNLYFTHGVEIEGVSNQLTLYADFGAPFGTSANEDNASSYVDGYKVLTMDVLPLASDTGFIDTTTGLGEDNISFKLTDSDKLKFGLTNNDLLLELSTSIISVDFSNGFPEAFNFGAFNNECGPLQNPFNGCGRETGTAVFSLSELGGDENVVTTPIPAAFGLLLSGFGLLSWMRFNTKETV